MIGVVVCRGVGCHERLQEMLTIMTQGCGGGKVFTDESFCIDNRAMVACTACFIFRSVGVPMGFPTRFENRYSEPMN